MNRDRLGDLLKEIADIRLRLDFVERQAKDLKQVPESSEEKVIPKSPEAETAEVASKGVINHEYESLGLSEQTKSSSENRLGIRSHRHQVRPDESSGASYFLGTIAGICFLLAGGYLIKLAVETGWLTPIRQVGLSFLLGLGLIVAGKVLSERDRSYSAVLPGVGIAILFLAVFGGRMVHGLYSDWHAAMGAGLVAILCVFLRHLFRQDIYLLFACVGSYFCPLLLPQLRSRAIDFMVFLFVWDVLYVLLSHFLHIRWIALLASYFGIGLFGALIPYTVAGNVTPPYLTWVAFQSVQFLFFLGALLVFSIKRRPLTEEESWAYFPLVLFFYGLQYYFLYKYDAGLAPWLGLAFASAILLVYVFGKSLLEKGSSVAGPMVYAIVSIIGFHSLYLELIPTRWTPWFSLGLFGLISLFFRKGTEKKNLAIPLLVLFSILFIDFGKVFLAVVDEVSNGEWVILGLLYSAAIFLFYQNRRGKEFAPVILSLFFLMAFSAIYRSVDWGLDAPKSTVAFVVSISWAVLGFGSLLFARSSNDDELAQGALFVLIVSAGKALLFDVANSSTIVRVVALLALGVVLYAAGYFYRKVVSS